MQRFPPAEDGPQFELASIGRTLDDLEPSEKVAATRGLFPLVWSALSLLALICFMTWLLLS